MSEVAARLLDCVLYDTQSEDDRESIPSTKKQFELAHKLAGELKELRASQVRVSEQGYVYTCTPTNLEEGRVCPSLSFIAHMGTAPSFSGKGVKSQFIRDYDGQDICLNREQNLRMRTADFLDLKTYEDKTLIAADGTTLPGADDKAGITEIMTMATYFLGHPGVKHGTVCIGLTPNKRVGRRADDFNVDSFGANVAYTVDSGALEELEYENFNATSGRMTVHGASTHPSTTKGRMRNALLIAMEFQSLLPANENPIYTEGYEDFYHLDRMTGCIEEARMDYIVRDHDRAEFERRKELFSQTAGFLNQKYGSGTMEATAEDSYYNMKEKIEPHMDLIDRVKASMEKLGIQPTVVPIRGGTSGAGLSYMGLLCPNLCTGGHNFHGKYEFIPVQSMEKITELLIEIARSFTGAQRWFVLS